MDAPLPGVVAAWDRTVRTPALLQFSLPGLDAQRLVEEREGIYLMWNDFTGDRSKPDDAARVYYAAQYAQPGVMRANFAQFAACAQDVEGHKIFPTNEIDQPVLAG